MAKYSVYDTLGVIADFVESFSSRSRPKTDQEQVIKDHLKQMDRINFHVPEFPKGSDWLNVSEALSFEKDLQGQITVLDFFTYCCINCMHILPDLEAVEQEFPAESGVAVIGVHSAKFLNEKVLANIKSAVLRYDIKHPVINDKHTTLWQELAVSCWPTLVFVGPQGQLIHSIAGEGHRKEILQFLKIAKEHYSSELKPRSLPMSFEKDMVPKSSLNFPGKVQYWAEKNWLVVSDTGNHRIVVMDLSGVVQHVIGSGHQGLKDGAAENAQFSSPQGVACDSQNIYVADTNNHCLRQISFQSNISVVTIAGIGRQGTDKVGGKPGLEQELASPWDVALGTCPDGKTPVLFVATAGTHQIWVYFLHESVWYKNTPYPAGVCINFAGSGLEENRNNAYPEKAGFAQPSGLALYTPKAASNPSSLFIADSESSSVRLIDLETRKVKGVVGGERDPTNLFAFGDIDGKGTDAKLQHPLGVAVLGDSLIVADSYNHKIKCVSIADNGCRTIAGCGTMGSELKSSELMSCQFNEPGGVSTDSNKELIFIADTNNHSIKVIDFKNESISQLPVVFSDEKDILDKSNGAFTESIDDKDITTLPKVTVQIGQTIRLSIPLELSPGEHFNMDAPHSWMLQGLDKRSLKLMESLSANKKKGNFSDILPDGSGKKNCYQGLINVDLSPESVQPGIIQVFLVLQIFVCLDDEDVCLPPRKLHFKQSIDLVQ